MTTPVQCLSGETQSFAAEEDRQWLCNASLQPVLRQRRACAWSLYHWQLASLVDTLEDTLLQAPGTFPAVRIVLYLLFNFLGIKLSLMIW